MEKNSNPKSFFTHKVDWLIFFFFAVLFIIPPLFFLELKQDEWVDGFIPIRMLNAELKFCIFVLFASLIVGIIGIRLNLTGYIKNIDKKVYIFGFVFVVSIFLSTLFSHNIERAFVSSFCCHLLPLALAFCITQIKWSNSRIIGFISLILIGAVISSLVVMDQHYQWTDWSHRLPRLGFGGLIYNQNFAAEYHAPILPITVGLFFFVKNRIIKGILISSLIFVFLPALALSLARGAWVGLIGGCLCAALVFVFIILRRKKDFKPNQKKAMFLIASSFTLLSLALPLYLFTSDYWKKGAFSKKETTQHSQTTPSIETQELKSITTVNASRGSKRRITLWKDALQAVLSKDFLFGKGTDHYELHFHESARRSDKTTGGTLVRFVHNDFIQILYENGIIGLIGFLGLWITVFWMALSSSIKNILNDKHENVAIILGLSSSSLVFLIESFFEFPSRSPCSMITGWTVLGLLIVSSNTSLMDRPKDSKVILKPFPNLIVGALSIWLIPFGSILAKNLFWTNIYHFQGRIAGDYGEKDKSLMFHRKAIEYAPWEHHSRKFECFYLLTHKKQFPEALDAINKTLEVHPGCLIAHQNKIAISINEFKDINMAQKAYRAMKKAAPFHPFTEQERRRIEQIKK